MCSPFLLLIPVVTYKVRESKRLQPSLKTSHTLVHDMEPLLLRENITLDTSNIANYIPGKRILITGAAGSIGRELVKHILLYHPEQLVAVDQSEIGIHELNTAFSAYRNLHTRAENITDASEMKKLFSSFRPEIVFHAAAYKHVVILETQPIPAIKNNIFGTCILAELSIEFGVEKFIFISTDKAVNPTSIMGVSKRISELYLLSLKTTTNFIITRFGNVLGSAGSVAPIFWDRIINNKSIEITHPEVTRYFITIPESVLLVLEAAAVGESGQILIFEMGDPIRIKDLACRMIKMYRKPDQQIDIIFTGLRPGEKLHEELQYAHEKTIRLHQGKIRVIHSENSATILIKTGIGKLRQQMKTATLPELAQAMKNLI
jgi:FlaA1/EpsC-like NDP-sugar epimerase